MIDWTELTLFIYITARMSGFVLFNPILGRTGIPTIFKSGLILVLSVFLFSTAGTTAAVVIPSTIVELGLRILLEMAMGYFLGLVINFFLFIAQQAGFVLDMQMGMTMNQIYDASAQANLSVSGLLLNALMTMLFFAANGHHTLLRIFLTSGELVSFGAAGFGDPLVSLMLELFLECVVLSVKLAMPFIASELVTQLGMGILMKVIPQINVFAINIELKVICGLVMLFVLIAPISEFLLKVEMTMLESLSQVLRLMG